MSEKTGRSMVKDLTHGSVTGLLVRFAMPLFVSNALQAVYNLVDMVVVGQKLGATGMSAVSTGGDILHLLTFVAMGFSSAGQVLIAKSVGAGRMDEVKKTIGNMFSFLLSVSLIISIVCFILRENILTWVNTPPEARAYTMDYTVTCIFGLFFIYGYNIVSAILRGMGDSKRPFVFIAVAAVLNTGLDILFVDVLDIKVFGAALATVIGQGVSFVASLIYLYIKRTEFGFDFKARSFVPDKPTLTRLIALGIPMAIQSAAVNLSKIVLLSWINFNGQIASAAAGIYNKINTMSGIVSNSFTTAGASMVGQNLGAKKYERIPEILKTTLMIGLSIAIAFTLVMLCWSETVFRLFTSDEAVILFSAMLVLPTIVNFFGSATRSMAFSLINGCGNTNLNLAVAIIDGMISRIGIAALLGFALEMGCKGFWMGDALAGFMPFVIGGTYYLSKRWMKKKEEA